MLGLLLQPSSYALTEWEKGSTILQDLHMPDVVIARKMSQICINLLTFHLLLALILSVSGGNEQVRYD